ncbi:hypothetical protein [Flavobacterium sp. W20_MBD1_R3]|uniref:hypothetical protein n=1 Tax=Flavobacterium sp. W20_MBD1_R3 TaxID=3240278 RepID=UPI003F92621B
MLFAYYIDGFVEKIAILKNSDIFAIDIFIRSNNLNAKIVNAEVIFDKKEEDQQMILIKEY